MDFKAAAIAATLAGSVLLTGLTFNGTINLNDIKNMGFGWADKVGTSVNETKDMLAKFNLFKSDVQTQLNAKIAKINELNAKIAELVAQVGSGEVSLEAANNEIARLNEEVEQANNEIQALKDQYGVKDAEVQAAFDQMATDDNMDTTLALDTQNPDTVVPTGSTETPETVSSDTAIKNAIQSDYSNLDDLVVTIEGSTVTLQGSNLGGYDYNTFIPYINNETGKTATLVSGGGTGTLVYTIN